jgi:hypothetical protein
MHSIFARKIWTMTDRKEKLQLSSLGDLPTLEVQQDPVEQ